MVSWFGLSSSTAVSITGTICNLSLHKKTVKEIPHGEFVSIITKVTQVDGGAIFLSQSSE